MSKKRALINNRSIIENLLSELMMVRREIEKLLQ